MDETSLLARGRPNGTPEAKRVALGAGTGAAIEVYDFIGFGTAAALYLGHAFFPESSPAVGTLFAFATLGVGFLARPLGGILAGYLGDRFGRKPVLVASLIVMGLGTVCLGLLPTYSQVGVVAPILLVIVRILQGLAFGAEWGGAVLMTYEHAPLDKKGTYTGIMHAGFAVGLLMANLAFLATAPLDSDWSWRIAFLASLVLIVVGLVIRSKLSESPVFEEVEAAGTASTSPLKQVVKEDWRLVLRGVALRVAEPAGYAVAVTFMLGYLQNNHLASKRVILTALCIAAAIGIIATPLWGRLSDRIGRRPLFIAGCAFGMAIAVPLFLLANTGSAVLIVVVVILAYPVFQNALVAAQGTILPELYRPQTRFSGCSLAYQLSAALAGFAPFVASALYLGFGWIGPALLLAFLAMISLLAALGIRETWDAQARELAQRLMARETDQAELTARGGPTDRCITPHASVGG